MCNGKKRILIEASSHFIWEEKKFNYIKSKVFRARTRTLGGSDYPQQLDRVCSKRGEDFFIIIFFFIFRPPLASLGDATAPRLCLCVLWPFSDRLSKYCVSAANPTAKLGRERKRE